MRKTVTISYSCDPEVYKKIMELKEQIEADRMDKINMSALLTRLINLGFAYRAILKAEAEDKKIKTKGQKTVVEDES